MTKCGGVCGGLCGGLRLLLLTLAVGVADVLGLGLVIGLVNTVHGRIVVNLLAEIGLLEVVLAGRIRQNGQVDHEKNGEKALQNRIPGEGISKEHDVGCERQSKRLERGISQHLAIRTSSRGRQALNFFSGIICLIDYAFMTQQ